MAKMGRPKIPKEQRRSERITFRVTAVLRKALNKQARREKKKLGAYIADVLENKIERGE
jgi:predicted HicB family RNase H-like nuclease